MDDLGAVAERSVVGVAQALLHANTVCQQEHCKENTVDITHKKVKKMDV